MFTNSGFVFYKGALETWQWFIGNNVLFNKEILSVKPLNVFVPCHKQELAFFAHVMNFDMETLSTIVALCSKKRPITAGFPLRRARKGRLLMVYLLLAGTSFWTNSLVLVI